MTTLLLPQFDNYDVISLNKYLSLQDSFNYEIVLDLSAKNQVLSDAHFIFQRYSTAAFAGQMLASISKNFTYTIPCIRSKPVYHFTFSTWRVAKLSHVLYFIICGCYMTDNIMLCTKFHAEKKIFWNGEGSYATISAVPGLIYIADKVVQTLR